MYYGRQGRINARELHETDELVQLPDADPGVRDLLAGQGDLAGRAVVQAGGGRDRRRVLERVSPIEWDNVLLYRLYVIDRSLEFRIA